MNDLDQDVAAKLLTIKQKKDAEKAQTIQQEPVEQKAETTSPVTEAVPIQKKEEAVTNKETEKPADQPAAETDEAPKAETEEQEFRWDADIVEEQKAQDEAPKVDFKKLGSALNLEINTEEELIKQVSEKMAKLKEVEEQTSKQFEGVPAELKEAIEIAKKGGDWYSYVEHSLIDVTKLDPIDLFEQEFERMEAHKYKNEDGSIDYERLDEALDAIPDALKTMQGNAIKNNLYLQQQQKKQQLQAQAQQAQEVFKSQLGEAMKELPNYFPKDTFGITLEQQHVASLYDGITSNKLVQKHLGITDPTVLSKIDPKKLARTLAMAEWSAGISKAQYNRGLTQAKRELLEKTQNAQINSTARSAEPEAGEGEKPKTAAEKLKGLMSGMIPQNSL
jgi:hypothetical protein